MLNKSIQFKPIYLATIVSTSVILFSANFGNRFQIMLSILFLLLGFFRPLYLIPVFFIASLSTDFFAVQEGVGFSRILALIFVMSVTVNSLVNRRPLRIKWLPACILIVVTTFISSMFSYSHLVFNNLDFRPLFIIGLNVLVLFAMENMKLDETRLTQVFRAILIAVLMATAYYAYTFITNPMVLINGRYTITEGLNENRFAMMMAQLAAFSFAYTAFTKKTTIRLICLCAGLTNAYFVLISGSRSALIGIVLGFLVANFIRMFVQKKIKKEFFRLVMVSVIFILIFYSVLESNSFLAKRMSYASVVVSQGTRRWPRIVAEIAHVIPKNLLIGVGPSAVNETAALAPIMNDPGSSHNFVVSMMAQLGIIGFLIYMRLFFKIIKSTIKTLRFNGILYIPLMLILTAVFNGIGEVIYSERLFWNTLSLAVMCLTVLGRNIEKPENNGDFDGDLITSTKKQAVHSR